MCRVKEIPAAVAPPDVDMVDNFQPPSGGEGAKLSPPVDSDGGETAADAGALLTMTLERLTERCFCTNRNCTGASFHIVTGLTQGPMLKIPHRARVQSIEAANLLQLTAYTFGLSGELLMGTGKTKSVVAARCFFVVLVRERLGWSWAEIAKTLRRDHSTVVHAYGRREHWQKLYALEWAELMGALK